MLVSKTLFDLKREAMLLLKDARIENADLDARLLLEAALEKDRAFCVLHPDYIPTNEERELFQSFIERRLAREPVAKIIGYKEFWSLLFKTTQDTLDPRPDSETLIEAVLKNYPDKNQKLKILDLGTGTGCLILSLLSEYKNARGVGLDVSQKALAVAKENAQSLRLETRVSFMESNWCEKLTGSFDIIISNPPYIPPSHEESLAPELSFDPNLALYGDDTRYKDLDDGLSAYHILAKNLRKHLKPEGQIFLEFGKDQHEDVALIFVDQGFKSLGFFKDLAGVIRCICLS